MNQCILIITVSDQQVHIRVARFGDDPRSVIAAFGAPSPRYALLSLARFKVHRALKRRVIRKRASQLETFLKSRDELFVRMCFAQKCYGANDQERHKNKGGDRTGNCADCLFIHARDSSQPPLRV